MELPGVHAEKVGVEGIGIQVYSAGQGPAVLLVHGWESSSVRLAELANSLIKEGFRVITFDMPGHGRSAGRDTDIIAVSRIIAEICRQHGPFVAGVGHSFGGMCVALAASRGWVESALVLISTPATFDGLIEKFCSILGIGPRSKQVFVRGVERRLRMHGRLAELSPVNNLPPLEKKLLVVHDRHDQLVPVEDAKTLFEACPSVELELTDGLGHSALLRDSRVISRCVSFLKSATVDCHNGASKAGTPDRGK